MHYVWSTARRQQVRSARASRMKVMLVLSLSAAVLNSGCAEQTVGVRDIRGPSSQTEPASPTSDARSAALELAQSGVRDFAEISDSLLWSFVVASDSLASVGIKAPGSKRGFDRGKWLVSKADWNAGRKAVAAIAGMRIVRADTLIPTLRVKVPSSDVLAHIRRLPFVSYVEPARMIDLNPLDPTGCGQEVWQNPPIGPSGDILPHTYPWMYIDRAWYYANGRGVKVGIVDTGIDGTQIEFGTWFATGESAGRTIEHGNDPFDYCGHGTRVAGVIAAPRNGVHVAGIAWAANVFSFRHGNAVEADAWGAANGVDAAGYAGSRVINMSFGTLLRYADLADRITYWYYNHDVVFVGAAGTFPCWWSSNNVAFPAEKAEVLAVSPAHYDGGRPCSAGYGPDLDLIAYHKQPTTGTADMGFLTPVWIAESSNASAVVAGVATLVRQRYPAADRNFVRNRLLSTAGTACGIYNTWHKMVNAEAAVGGICASDPIGPQQIDFNDGDPDSKTVSYTINASGGAGPLDFTWKEGYKTQTIYVTFYRPGTDPGDRDYMTAVYVDIRDTGSPHVPPLRKMLPVRVVNWSAVPCWERPVSVGICV